MKDAGSAVRNETSAATSGGAPYLERVIPHCTGPRLSGRRAEIRCPRCAAVIEATIALIRKGWSVPVDILRGEVQKSQGHGVGGSRWNLSR
jgi:hypothetical protein